MYVLLICYLIFNNVFCYNNYYKKYINIYHNLKNYNFNKSLYNNWTAQNNYT